MYKTFKLLFSLSLFICFSGSAQTRIWGISPDGGYDCSGFIWAMQTDDSSSFSNYINYNVNPDGILFSSTIDSNGFIEDGEFYYGFSGTSGCDSQIRLMRFDKNGYGKQLKVFSNANLSIFKGDNTFIYVVNYSTRKLLRVEKTDGTTLEIFDLDSNEGNLKIIAKNNTVFINNGNKLYRINTNGSGKTEILDFNKIKQSYGYYTSMVSDDNNIYVSYGNLSSDSYFIIVPLQSPKNYVIKEIENYIVNSHLSPVVINGNLYVLATHKKANQRALLLKINTKFTSFNEIAFQNGNNYYSYTYNSKKIVFFEENSYVIFEADKETFISVDKTFSTYRIYFPSESLNKINFISPTKGVGFFNTDTQKEEIKYKFEILKKPFQIIEAIGNKLAFVERVPNTQADYLSEIDMTTGKVIKSLQLPGHFFNNVLPINDKEYLFIDMSSLYTDYGKYIFSMDSVFKKIEMPVEFQVLPDSMYKVKGRIFADAYSLYNQPRFVGICEFKDNTFSKFIDFKTGGKVKLIESDDEFIYICQALENFKTFKFYRVNPDGSNLTDLNLIITGLANYNLSNPKCFKIGDYIYGFKERQVFFRINLKTKKVELQDTHLLDLQYLPRTKELFALSYDWQPPNNTLNNLFLVNQENFTLTNIKQVNRTTSFYVEREKIEHAFPKITSIEENNNTKEFKAFPNPVVNFVTVNRLSLEIPLFKILY